MNKPSTPITINQGMGDSVTKGFGIPNQIGQIKRQNSNKPRDNNMPSDRPSTAPSKNDNNSINNRDNRDNRENIIKANYVGAQKRLPSPVIKCKFLILKVAYNLNNANSKQILNSGNMGGTMEHGGARYRAPSPQTSTLSKLGLGGSFKAQPTTTPSINLKTQKWK